VSLVERLIGGDSAALRTVWEPPPRAFG